MSNHLQKFIIRRLPSQRIVRQCFSSSDVEQCRKDSIEESEWARRPNSAALIKPPPYKTLDPFVQEEVVLGGGPAEWSKIRGWDISDGAALRVLSHTLTFPLTLAQYAVKLKVTATQHKERSTLIVYCAGARAESTLPEIWWNEALLALSNHVNQLHLVFIGPEVTTFKSSEIQFYDIDGNVSSSLKRHYFAGTLTDYFESNQYLNLRSEYDNNQSNSTSHSMIWLSNPGLGHPALRESWASSLSWLLSQNSDNNEHEHHNNDDDNNGTAVLVTSHSEKDQLRDIEAFLNQWKFSNHQNTSSHSVLNKQMEHFHLLPECSKYKSMRRVVDNCSVDGNEMVQANWGAFGFISPKQV